MRRVVLMTCTVLAVIAAISGCGQRSEPLSEMSADSLLASNPVEQPEGDLSPQTEFQEEPQRETPPPPPAPVPQAKPKPKPSPPPARTPTPEPRDEGVTLAAGSMINVSVTTQISSETASPGDTWIGEVKDPVIVGDQVVIPAGSTVNGVVSAVQPAEKGGRAFLVLAVESVNIHGQSHSVYARADSIIAGSARARNLGAIAGGAAAGALIGKAVGGSGKGALIGGLLGGAAAGGAVAKSKGYQVVIKEGTVIDFSVRQSVRVRS